MANILPVAKGGTGTNGTATGSGGVVLKTAPSLDGPVTIATATAGTVPLKVQTTATSATADIFEIRNTVLNPTNPIFKVASNGDVNAQTITASAIKLNGSNPLVVDVTDAGYFGSLIEAGIAGSQVFIVGNLGDVTLRNVFAGGGATFDGGVAVNGPSDVLYVLNSAQIDNSLSVGNGITNLEGGITNDGGIFNNTGGIVNSDGVITSTYNILGSVGNTFNLDFETYQNIQITPTLTTVTPNHITASVPAAGTYCTLIINTTGTTSRTLTFNSTYFRITGTLATGTTNNRWFTITFVSDGNKLMEISRTTSMAT
jgi:hypothetical protein